MHHNYGKHRNITQIFSNHEWNSEHSPTKIKAKFQANNNKAKKSAFKATIYCNWVDPSLPQLIRYSHILQRFEINNWFAHLAIFWHDKIRLTCTPWKIKPGYDFESADGSGGELSSSSRHPSDIEPRNWSSEVLKQSVIEGVTPAVMADYFSFVGSCRVLKLFVLLFVLTRLPYPTNGFDLKFSENSKTELVPYNIRYHTKIVFSQVDDL